MDQLRIKQDKAHQVEWELRKRTQETEELNRALDQCQQHLGSERGTIEEMTIGGDALKQKKNQNKNKILQLLESSNSVEQHVYYQKGESPEKIQQYYMGVKGQGITGGKVTMAPELQPNLGEMKSSYKVMPDKKPNVLRTIYMPNYEVDNARDEIEVLRKEIGEERVFYEGIMKKLQEDKALFEEEQRSRYLMLERKYVETIENLHQKEQYNTAVVKDHMELKHFFEMEERVKNEENEAINQENQMMRSAIRALCRETKNTVDTAKQDYELNSEEFSAKFREQNAQHAQNTFVIREQYKKLSKMYQEKKDLLKDRLNKDTERLTMMESKRKLDLEGFGSDLSNLKKRMVFYQNYIGKLKKLVDKDQENSGVVDMQGGMFGMDQEDVILEEACEE